MRRSGNESGRGKRCERLKGCEKVDNKGMAWGIEKELMRGARGRKGDLVVDRTRMELIDLMVEKTKMRLSKVEKRRMKWMRAAR